MNLAKSTDKPELISKIRALQLEYKDVFDQLKWCLNAVYTIDYKAMLCMEDIDEKRFAGLRRRCPCRAHENLMQV